MAGNLPTVTMPYWMGSMDKIKPHTGELESWMSKNLPPYLITPKLDGVSGLYFNDNGIIKFYTGGDGHTGSDVSHLLTYMNLPELPEDTAVRGELIIKREIFTERFAGAYKNPRNTVSGVVNSKPSSVNTAVAGALDFVVYEVLSSPDLPPSEQIQLAKNMGLLVVHTEIVDHMDSTMLISKLNNSLN